MTAIIVTVAETLDEVDPARVWAFVADPSNLTEWAPARRAGFIGTELPNVGHTLFLHRRRRERPDDVWRCRIDEWDAGHRIRVTLETPGAAQDQRVDVVVETRGTGAHPAAAVALTYRADVPALLAPLYRGEVSRMIRRAIRDIVGAVTT